MRILIEIAAHAIGILRRSIDDAASKDVAHQSLAPQILPDVHGVTPKLRDQQGYEKWQHHGHECIDRWVSSLESIDDAEHLNTLKAKASHASHVVHVV